MPYGTAEFLHCYIGDNQKRAFDQHGNPCDPSANENHKIYGDEDWPTEKGQKKELKMHVVIIEQNSGRGSSCRLHIAPWAMERFKEMMIVEAFEKVTMSPTFPKKKFITGWTHHNHPSVFHTFDYTKPGFVEKYSQCMADDEEKPEEVSRMKGICFPRHEYMTNAEASLIFDEPLVHKTDRQRQMMVYQAEISRRSEPYVLIPDLEYYSALQQHVRCGLPLDVPIHTPDYIRDRYTDSVAPDEYDKGRNYPISFVKTRRKNVARKRKYTSFAKKYDRAALVASERSMDMEYEDDEKEEISPKRKDSGKGKAEEVPLSIDNDMSLISPSSSAKGIIIQSEVNLGEYDANHAF